MADSFTVESFYNGQLHSYVISVQNGIPVTMHLATEPTTEENGLKLSIAVETKHLGLYADKAVELYKYFDHKPELNLDLCLEVDKQKVISDDWFIKETQDRWDRTNYVVMSQILYEIPTSDEVKTHDFANLVMKVPPGSVSFNPGRESLSLDQKTINFLNAQFDKVKEEYLHNAILTMSEAENDKELYAIFKDLTFSAPKDIARQIDAEDFFSDHFKTLYDTALPNRYYYTLSNSSIYNYVHATSSFLANTNNELRISYRPSYRTNYKPLNYENQQSTSSFFEKIHVIVDVKTKYKYYIEEEFDEQDTIFIWQREPGKDIESAVEHAKNYLDTLTIPYVLVSDLVTKHGDTPTNSKKENRQDDNVFASHICSYGMVSKSTLVTDADLKNQQYLYVKLSNTTPILQDADITASEYFLGYRLLERTGTDVPSIKGVPKKYQAAVDDLDNWIDFETYIKEALKEKTFKVPVKGEIPKLSHTAINLTNVNNFPTPIQDLYFEIRNYNQFTEQSDFINCETAKHFLDKLNVEFVEYEPEREVDMEVIERVYPRTYDLLRDSGVNYYLPKNFISEFAKMEEYYATRPAD